MNWVEKEITDNEKLEKYQLIENELDRPRTDVFSIIGLACEALDCSHCPVKLYDYDKRTDREKIDGIPCAYNLLNWVKDEINKK